LKIAAAAAAAAEVVRSVRETQPAAEEISGHAAHLSTPCCNHIVRTTAEI